MSRTRHIPLEIAPSPTSAGDEYLIRSAIEIVFILRAIMRKNALVSLYVDQGNDVILTSILDIDADRNKLVLDYGANEQFNQRALMAEKLTCVTTQDQVKVQFFCHSLQKIQFEGRSAFSLDIPDSLLRLQRREYYRIATPAITPLKCAIPLAAGRGMAEVVLLDISCGGIGVIDHHPKIDFEPGTVYENCRIALPDIGIVNVSIQVKTTFEDTLANGLTCKRSRCEFIAAPENMLAMIQRYINKLERARNAKKTGLG